MRDHTFWYTDGELICCARWPVCLLVDLAAEDQRVLELDALLEQDQPIPAVIDFLCRDGVMHTPTFGLLLVGHGEIRLVTHGAVNALVDGWPVKSTQEFTELSVSAESTVSLVVEEDDLLLPLSGGVVRAGAVVCSMEAPDQGSLREIPDTTPQWFPEEAEAEELRSGGPRSAAPRSAEEVVRPVGPDGQSQAEPRAEELYPQEPPAEEVQPSGPQAAEVPAEEPHEEESEGLYPQEPPAEEAQIGEQLAAESSEEGLPLKEEQLAEEPRTEEPQAEEPQAGKRSAEEAKARRPRKKVPPIEESPREELAKEPRIEESEAKNPPGESPAEEPHAENPPEEESSLPGGQSSGEEQNLPPAGPGPDGNEADEVPPPVPQAEVKPVWPIPAFIESFDWNPPAMPEPAVAPEPPAHTDNA